MKRKASFFLVLAVSILCGVVACAKIQIPAEVERPHEKAQQEKKAPDRTIPPEAPRQKTIQKEATQQEAAQKEATQKEVAPKEGFSAGGSRKIIPPDTFTRTYAIDFGSFYGQANAALQDHARTHKGNSFHVSRMGSDAVILRGVYLRAGGQEKYVPILTIKPSASQKSRLEIKFDSSVENPSSPNPDVAAKEIFQIIEKATGKAAR